MTISKAQRKVLEGLYRGKTLTTTGYPRSPYMKVHHSELPLLLAVGLIAKTNTNYEITGKGRKALK